MHMHPSVLFIKYVTWLCAATALASHITCGSSPCKNTHVPLNLIPCLKVDLGTLLTAADLRDKFHPVAENTHAQLNPSIPCPVRLSNCSKPQRQVPSNKS